MTDINQQQEEELKGFNACNYTFVSTRIAKVYPHLIESKIVLDLFHYTTSNEKL